VLNFKYRLLVADGKKRVHTIDSLKLADTQTSHIPLSEAPSSSAQS